MDATRSKAVASALCVSHASFAVNCRCVFSSRVGGELRGHPAAAGRRAPCLEETASTHSSRECRTHRKHQNAGLQHGANGLHWVYSGPSSRPPPTARLRRNRPFGCPWANRSNRPLAGLTARQAVAEKQEATGARVAFWRSTWKHAIAINGEPGDATAASDHSPERNP
jgi:hypothetical protein